ncbi:hypothetical protein [Leptospira meyeri]|uniref:hypothetical protein n=1 Tax=Leptospira meyeri TaxID=29508 RepID=UPI00223CBC9C|nr:hypothetical protein [Leptospira meyeri]MCW7489019.1 hypothetical protein [Leptospira meyeri]
MLGGIGIPQLVKKVSKSCYFCFKNTKIPFKTVYGSLIDEKSVDPYSIFLIIDRKLGYMKSLIFILFLTMLNCTDQKDFCRQTVERKGGGFFEGDAESLCASYLVFDNTVRINIESGRPSSAARFFSDQYLVRCLYKTIEERKCDQKSEYIPHFGY